MPDDDLTVDFTGSETYDGDFEPIPGGWYKCVVSDWESVEVKKTDGKFPMGTKGTKWELTVDEGEYENRKVWVTYWHHPTSLPFFKGFLVATEKYNEDDLSGAVNINDIRDGAVGQTLMVKVGVRPKRGEYEASNEVRATKRVGEKVAETPSDSLLP